MDYKCEVVAEQEDYQLTLNRGKVEASTLLVTFGPIGSRKDTQGFGTSQAMKNNADNLYVSQRRGTSYQQLSRETFWGCTQGIFPKYERILFYGHSLGGYASLYYSWNQKAEVFSICPRCPAHPMWRTKYAKFNQEFRHQPVIKSPGSYWTVLWDPEDPDNRFVETLIGFDKIDKEIRVKKLGHSGAPKILTLNGSLQRFVSDWIQMSETSSVPSYDQGTNFVLLNSTARRLIKKQHFMEAIQLLETSLNVVDTVKARELLAQAREGMNARHQAAI